MTREEFAQKVTDASHSKILSWHTITVCGMKGTGKSTLEKVGLLPQYRKVLVFDPNDEFREFPQYVPKTDNPMELDAVAKKVWNEGNMVLVVSEAELYLPVAKPLPPNIFKVITRGRHRNVGLIVDTRRVANLNKTVFGLSEHVFIFRHFSPTDYRYLQEFVPRECRSLATLQDFHYWHFFRGVVVEMDPIPMPKGSKALKPAKKQSRPVTDSKAP